MVYNFTAINEPRNQLGASLSILTQVAALWAIYIGSFGKRKRRDVEETVEEQAAGAEVHHLLVKILFDLDEYGCSAGAICESAQRSPQERTSGQILLLNTFSISGEDVIEWNRLSQPEGKFEYAAFIGRHSNLVNKENLCRQAFPNCPTSFSKVTDALSSKTSPACLTSGANFLFGNQFVSNNQRQTTPQKEFHGTFQEDKTTTAKKESGERSERDNLVTFRKNDASLPSLLEGLR